MDNATKGTAAVTEAQESLNPEPVTEKPSEVLATLNDLSERIGKVEALLKQIVLLVPLDDEPVQLPKKKNNNPDRLPTGGGKPVGYKDLQK